MTISSSLNAGVAGLTVNASRLSSISDNIANSGTFGYKRAVTDFESLVNSGAHNIAVYSAGGVRSVTYRMVSQTGSLVSTSNALDIAANGRGMLPVTSAAAVKAGDSSLPLMMITTGGFHANSAGVLETSSGLVLLGWPANADGSVTAVARDSIQGLKPVVINANQTASDPTTRITMGVNLPASATQAGADGESQPLSVEYFGNLGESETLAVSFSPTVPLSGASNAWRMTIADSAQGGATVGTYDLVFNDARGSGGTLVSVTTVSGGSYDPATGTIPLTVGGGPITLTVGKPGDAAGLTQLASGFAPTSITRDGSPVGNLTSTSIDANGMISATYDTGFTRVIYQVPLIDVPNPDGLLALDNQAYQVSPDSGSFYLWDAGTGPTGTVSGYALEGSTTDIAAELTGLIQTQRAYSSNAKVIQTVALSVELDTDLPVEIWFCTVFSWSLMLCRVCRATIALVLVRIEDMRSSFGKVGGFAPGFIAPRAVLHGPF